MIMGLKLSLVDADPNETPDPVIFAPASHMGNVVNISDPLAELSMLQ